MNSPRSEVEVASALNIPSYQGKWWKISTEARRQEDVYYETGMFGYFVADCADVEGMRKLRRVSSRLKRSKLYVDKGFDQ